MPEIVNFLDLYNYLVSILSNALSDAFKGLT